MYQLWNYLYLFIISSYFICYRSITMHYYLILPSRGRHLLHYTAHCRGQICPICSPSVLVGYKNLLVGYKNLQYLTFFLLSIFLVLNLHQVRCKNGVSFWHPIRTPTQELIRYIIACMFSCNTGHTSLQSFTAVCRHLLPFHSLRSPTPQR